MRELGPLLDEAETGVGPVAHQLLNGICSGRRLAVRHLDAQKRPPPLISAR